MQTAVFGAAGFIGRVLVEQLRADGEDVLAFDVSNAPPQTTGGGASTGKDVAPGSLLWQRCDVTRDAVDLDGCQRVLYLSQSPHYRAFPERGDHLFAVNVVGALRCLEAARAAKAESFVYCSSGSVYAPSFDALSEDSELRRDDAYSLSKLCAEDALSIAARSFASDGTGPGIACARLFGVFGPGQHTMLVPGLRKRIEEGQAISVERHPSDTSDRGGLRISLTYVDDAARCLHGLAKLASQHRGQKSDDTSTSNAPPSNEAGAATIVNVAGPEALSIRKLAEGIAQRLGLEAKFEDADRARQSDFVADSSRLHELLAPSFVSIEDALDLTIPNE